jgi:outer membrane protein assembly factor BamB
MVVRNNIIACPVFDRGRVYLAMGQDPNHGQGKGQLHAIDAGGIGDVTKSHRIWTCDDVGRSICTPVVYRGLLYLADLNGIVYSIDLSTGSVVWTHDLVAPVWSAVIIADDKLFVGDEDGTVTIMRTGRTCEILGKMDMAAPIWSTPAVAANVLYIATSQYLYAIGFPE